MREGIELDFGAFFIIGGRKRKKERELFKGNFKGHSASIRGRAGNTTSFNYFHIDVMTYISNSNRKKDPANHSVCLCYQTHPSLLFPPEQ